MVVPGQLWWGSQFKICISYMLCFDWDAQGTFLIYIAGLSQTQVVVHVQLWLGGHFKICISLCRALIGVLKEHV